jgi:uncharacterized protein (TIRG00374 family)
VPGFLRSKRFWGIIAGLALLVWCFHDLDFKEVTRLLVDLKFEWVVAASAIVVVVLWIRSVRWRILLSPLSDVGSARMFSLYSVGQLANVMFPALTGQAVRVLMINRALGVTRTGVVSTVLLEALLDGLSLVLFMAGASLVLELPDWLQQGVRVGTVVILSLVLLLGVVIRFRHSLSARIERLEVRLPESIFRRIDRLWVNFSDGLAAVRSLRRLTLAFLCSMGSWLGNLLVILFLIYAFQLELPPGAALVLMIINTLMMIIPVSPGNVGTFQLACVLGLNLFGVPKPDAVSFGLILHATTLVPVAALGTYHYFKSPWKVPDLAQAQAASDELF